MHFALALLLTLVPSGPAEVLVRGEIVAVGQDGGGPWATAVVERELLGSLHASAVTFRCGDGLAVGQRWLLPLARAESAPIGPRFVERGERVPVSSGAAAEAIDAYVIGLRDARDRGARERVLAAATQGASPEIAGRAARDLDGLAREAPLSADAMDRLRRALATGLDGPARIAAARALVRSGDCGAAELLASWPEPDAAAALTSLACEGVPVAGALRSCPPGKAAPVLAAFAGIGALVLFTALELRRRRRAAL